MNETHIKLIKRPNWMTYNNTMPKRPSTQCSNSFQYLSVFFLLATISMRPAGRVKSQTTI